MQAQPRVLTRETVAKLYRIPASAIADFVEFDPGNAIKFTIYRLRPSGSPGDPDIFGAQQYAPLLDVEVDLSALVGELTSGCRWPAGHSAHSTIGLG